MRLDIIRRVVQQPDEQRHALLGGQLVGAEQVAQPDVVRVGGLEHGHEAVDVLLPLLRLCGQERLFGVAAEGVRGRIGRVRPGPLLHVERPGCALVAGRAGDFHLHRTVRRGREARDPEHDCVEAVAARVGDGRGRLAVDHDLAGRELHRIGCGAVCGHFPVEGQVYGRHVADGLAFGREGRGHGRLVRTKRSADLFDDGVPAEEKVVLSRRGNRVVVHERFVVHQGDARVAAVVPRVDGVLPELVQVLELAHPHVAVQPRTRPPTSGPARA